MNIYCAGAIKGDISYQHFYKEIVEHLSETGHIAYSELNQEFFTSRALSDREIFTRDIQWLKESELMIAEISGPSLGVGFEISFALYVLNIPVLALYHLDIGKVSAMISGCSSDLISVNNYSTSEELRELIDHFIAYNSTA